MSKASDTAKAVWEATKDIPIGTATSTTTTVRTWSRKHDDGTVETTTETTKDFTIKPSKTGAKLGALAGATHRRLSVCGYWGNSRRHSRLDIRPGMIHDREERYTWLRGHLRQSVR
ncbi:MAG: hypothetical protein IJG37_03640 [Synergistaceae bacterium]|nr:hypothetical protein [Synergistaceae bacterium]MBQ7168715.1 hypothetical protein [Synergistaceae bacterium]